MYTGQSMDWSGSGLRFTGVGHYYPRSLVRHLAGAEVSGRAYTQADIDALGVRSLHRADEDETLEFMAVRAAKAALAKAGHDAREVDLVVLANWTDRQWIPELGPAVAAAMGAPQALAFDVCGACTGFVHAVQVAAAMLKAQPKARRAVVIAADRFTRRARPGTRGELVFGDAAGAVVLEKGEPELTGLRHSLLGCDASEADTVAARDGWLRPKPELIDLAVRSSLAVADQLLHTSGLKIVDIQWLVPHPGNNLIHTGVLDGLDLPEERFVTNFADRGNTGCASIPSTLSEYTASGLLRPGDLVLSTAVGSGWYFGGLIFRL